MKHYLDIINKNMKGKSIAMKEVKETSQKFNNKIVQFLKNLIQKALTSDYYVCLDRLKNGEEKLTRGKKNPNNIKNCLYNNFFFFFAVLFPVPKG